MYILPLKARLQHRLVLSQQYIKLIYKIRAKKKITANRSLSKMQKISGRGFNKAHTLDAWFVTE